MRNHVRFSSTVLALTVALTAGCSGGGGGGGSKVVGVWQYASGGFLPEIGTLTYLELRDDGTGEAFGATGSGVLGCGAFLFAVVSDDVLQLNIPVVDEDSLIRYTVVGKTLTLIDVDGAATTFTRTTAVPATAKCEASVETARVAFADAPGGFTSLTFDGTNLYYAAQSGVVLPVNATTMTVGAPITTLGSYDNIVTMEGSDFWGHCGCGGSPEAQRTTIAGAVVDVVDTGVDLLHDISVRAGAFDGSRLWLYGDGDLLRVNSGLEPDVLDSVLTLDFFPQALDFEGGQMWALVNQVGPVLVAFNTSTGDASRTIKLPPGDYNGLVVTGTVVHLLARTDSGAEIVTLSLP